MCAEPHAAFCRTVLKRNPNRMVIRLGFIYDFCLRIVSHEHLFVWWPARSPFCLASANMRAIATR